MAVGTPPKEQEQQGDQEFKIGKNQETLQEYFKPALTHSKVTRGELGQILQLFTSKGNVHEAMQVLEFNLRRAMRQMIHEEAEAYAAQQREGMSEGGIILPPGS